MIAAKRVPVNDAVQERACDSGHKPSPEDQPDKFSVRHGGYPASNCQMDWLYRQPGQRGRGARQKRLQHQCETGTHAWFGVVARIVGVAVRRLRAERDQRPVGFLVDNGSSPMIDTGLCD